MVVLRDEINKLQRSMFSLNEQSGGGVPKIFLQATDRARSKGFVTSFNQCNGEVEILEERSDVRGNVFNKSIIDGSCNMDTKMEVIELL